VPDLKADLRRGERSILAANQFTCIAVGSLITLNHVLSTIENIVLVPDRARSRTMMTASVDVAFEGGRTEWNAGEALMGAVHIIPISDEAIRRAELSILWFTEGKGEKDEGILYFRVLDEGALYDETRAYPFSIVLPPMPVTYAGELVKIVWVVRVCLS